MKNLLLVSLALFLSSTVCLAKAGQSRNAQRPVKLRAGPAVFHPVLERLEKGCSLSVLKEGSKWVKVRSPKGTEGWVSVRVFSHPPKPRAYSALLKERGLTGVSVAVPTMASRGLNAAATTGGGVAPLVRDFLEQVPFAPKDFDGFVGKLHANGICEELPGWLEDMAIPIAGDPQQDELERAFGMRLAISILSDAELLTDPAIDSYVNKVGSAVAAASSRYDLQWRFVVFKADRKEAFSVPGGFVFISSSLLRALRDEAELAGVLAHLVAHVALGHGAAQLAKLDSAKSSSGKKPMGQLVADARRLVMSARIGEEELEADAFGATYSACAGYDPAGLASVLKRVGCFEPGCKSSSSVGKRLALIHRVRNNTGDSPGARLAERFSGSVLAVLSKSP